MLFVEMDVTNLYFFFFTTDSLLIRMPIAISAWKKEQRSTSTESHFPLYTISTTRLESISFSFHSAMLIPIYICDIGMKENCVAGKGGKDAIYANSYAWQNWCRSVDSQYRAVNRNIEKYNVEIRVMYRSRICMCTYVRWIRYERCNILVWTTWFSIAKLLTSARLYRNANRNWYFAPMYQCQTL